MTPAEQQELRDFVVEHYPEFTEMVRFTESEHSSFKWRMARVLPRILHMQELKKTDPARFAVELAEQRSELHLRLLVRQYRAACEPAERKTLAEQIRPLVEAHFDARQQRLVDEVSTLEARLAELREEIVRQQENRDEEIEALYQRILEGGPPEFRRPKRGPEENRRGPGEGRGRRRGEGRGPRHEGQPGNPPPQPPADSAGDAP